MAKKKSVKKANAITDVGPDVKARVLKSRVEASGKTARGKGHLSAATRRSQAKRDNRGS